VRTKNGKVTIDDALLNGYEFSEEDKLILKRVPNGKYTVTLEKIFVGLKNGTKTLSVRMELKIKKGDLKGCLIQKFSIIEGKPLYFFISDMHALGKEFTNVTELKEVLRSILGTSFNVKLENMEGFTSVVILPLVQFPVVDEG
jgi:hypothetical protein